MSTTPRLTSNWWEHAVFIQSSSGFGKIAASISIKYFSGFWLKTDLAQETYRGEICISNPMTLLCNDACEETVHLFLHCRFARSCWNLFGVHVPTALGLFQIFESLRSQLRVYSSWRSSLCCAGASGLSGTTSSEEKQLVWIAANFSLGELRLCYSSREENISPPYFFIIMARPACVICLIFFLFLCFLNFFPEFCNFCFF